MNNKQRRRFLSLLIGGIIALSLSIIPTIKISAAGEMPPGKYKTLSELDGKTIGVAEGTITDRIVEERFPNATIKQFNSMSDVVEALKSGKIDAFFDDEPILLNTIAENPDLTYIEEDLFVTDYGCIFPKNEKGAKLRDEFNEWLSDFKISGELAKLRYRWTKGPEEERVVPDYSKVPGTKGSLVLATTGTGAPFNYYVGTEPVGIDIDLLARFCIDRDYKLEISTMSFAAIIPYIQSGRGDVGASAISITEERAQSVYFSESYYEAGARPLIKRTDAIAGNFFDTIANNFQKTFIKENRWRLFAEGLLNTMILTVLSIILGTALGYGVFMACRNGNKALNKVFAICTWIIQGMPMVVLLMVLYYIIFASVAIDGLYVAVLGFTLTFGAAVFGMLRTGVSAIDRGQYEAAYALGYSNRKTFYKVIFPQALPFILPSYKSEIVGLIKATAIVGYIAVPDLTKMADIVRSRTYEAFFALISLSIIYFLIEGLIAFLVSRIEININPKRRKREDILKGVKTDD